MDIRSWPLDRIMQLPDNVFGRRWPITFTAELAGSSYGRFISPMALPERCVLWQILFTGTGGFANHMLAELALGDQDPISNAIFDTFEPLFQPNAGNAWVPRGMPAFQFIMMRAEYRYPIIASGRRIAVRFDNSGEEATARAYLSLSISSMPTEVPEWLISGQGRGQ